MDSRQETRVTLPKRKRRSDDDEMDITPMIDMTFLLLSFFVVVSKMDPNTQVLMPKAKWGTAVPEPASVILIVSATDSETPIVNLGRARSPGNLATGTIEDVEEAIARYVETELKNPLKTTVIVKAERKVKYRHLDIVKRAISRGLAEGQVINVGIEEE
jgi:biopolymer transport protein ExbD